MTRLRLVLSIQFEALDPGGAPKLIGRAVTAALAELAERHEIGPEPVVVGLLNAKPLGPRRAPASTR